MARWSPRIADHSFICEIFGGALAEPVGPQFLQERLVSRPPLRASWNREDLCVSPAEGKAEADGVHEEHGRLAHRQRHGMILVSWLREGVTFSAKITDRQRLSREFGLAQRCHEQLYRLITELNEVHRTVPAHTRGSELKQKMFIL